MSLLSSPGHHSVFQVSQQCTPYPKGRQSSRSRCGQSQPRTIMTKAENCNKEYIVHKSCVCVCLCFCLILLTTMLDLCFSTSILRVQGCGSPVSLLGIQNCWPLQTYWLKVCLIIRSLGDGFAKKAWGTLHWMTFFSSQTRCNFLHLLGSLFSLWL